MDKSISKVIRAKLYASLPNEELESDCCDTLLRKNRLLVIVDRLSERSGETQNYIRKVYRSTRFECSDRHVSSPITCRWLGSTLLFPQPLNSASLLSFMTTLLKSVARGKNESSPAEAGPLETMAEQLKLAGRLESLIHLRTPDGEQEVPTLPLPVRLFVEQAVHYLST